MSRRVVLVTGVSRQLGARLAAELAAEPDVARVVGVDAVPPDDGLSRQLHGVEFVRADIRNPLIAKVISTAAVDSVVHLPIASPPGSGGRAAMKEMNVIGTMQLLAACQKADCVRRLVVSSTTAVYGLSPRDPAAFTEDTEPRSTPRSGFAKDAVEIEGYVRGFARRRPDVTLCLLRLANVVGPTIDTPLTRYLSLPVVPTVLGYDPRLQFLHEDDAAAVLRAAVRRPAGITVNVAGAGVLTLSQAIRRCGRVAAPVPAVAIGPVVRALRRVGGLEFSPEATRFVNVGRVVDTTRLHAEFGFRPRYDSAAAFDAFVRGRGLSGLLDPDLVAGLERRLRAFAGGVSGG